MQPIEIALINIGNSKGIRLPKFVLEQYHIGAKLEMLCEADCIVLRPLQTPRTNWEEAFRLAISNGSDDSDWVELFDDEDFEPWTHSDSTK